MLEDGMWTNKGAYSGRLIDKAFEALEAVSLTATLSIQVLDSVSGDDRLGITLMSRDLIDDMKMGRIGPEWHLERSAIAEQTAEDFNSNWPVMRQNIRENYLVSLCSATEHFIKTVLVEFPPTSASLQTDDTDIDNQFEHARLTVDNEYRRASKSAKSASRAWVSLFDISSIPASAKSHVVEWGGSIHAHLVDELVLLRNDLVHRAGEASSASAMRLGVKPGARVRVDDERVRHYDRACSALVVSLYPAL